MDDDHILIEREGDYGPAFRDMDYAEKWRRIMDEALKERLRQERLHKRVWAHTDKHPPIAVALYRVEGIGKTEEVDFSDFFRSKPDTPRADERNPGVSMGCP